MNVDRELGRVVELDSLDQLEYPFENKVEGQLSMLLPSILRPSYQLKFKKNQYEFFLIDSITLFGRRHFTRLFYLKQKQNKYIILFICCF
jgi:hypothetical protein